MNRVFKCNLHLAPWLKGPMVDCEGDGHESLLREEEGRGRGRGRGRERERERFFYF